jgi:hypothetical protein
MSNTKQQIAAVNEAFGTDYWYAGFPIRDTVKADPETLAWARHMRQCGIDSDTALKDVETGKAPYTVTEADISAYLATLSAEARADWATGKLDEVMTDHATGHFGIQINTEITRVAAAL